MTNTSVHLMEVVLYVDDVEGIVAFYRDVLGFDFQPSDSDSAPARYNACGGTWEPEGLFFFTIFHADSWATRSEIGFEMLDIDAVWERAKAYDGAQIEAPKAAGHVPRHAVIADTAGNRINLYQRANEG